MAFLVCYSATVEDHGGDRAAYLPRVFYETVFRVCRHRESGFPILGRIASLSYKSPVLLVGPDELPQLVVELRRLPDESGGWRDLLAAASEAIVRPCSLTISGDMYPELAGRDVVDQPPMRRVRATFWLRCVIFAACVAPLLCGLQFGMSGPWIVAFVIVALFPPGIELVLVGLAAGSRGSLSPVWFLDVDRQRRQAMQDFHDDTNENPTLR